MVIASLLLCVSCIQRETAEELRAIGFESGLEGTQTKAQTLGRPFFVWGVKDMGSLKEMVMNGYTVVYDGTYSYVGQTSLAGNVQSVKFWDAGASSYSFWGLSCDESLIDRSGVQESSLISGRSVRLKDLSASDEVYISSEHEIYVEAFGQQVRMPFERLSAEMRIGFYETMPDRTITDISATVTGHFLTLASYDYSFGTSTLELASGASVSTDFPYDGGVVSQDGQGMPLIAGTSSSNAPLSRPYLLLPVSEASEMTVSITFTIADNDGIPVSVVTDPISVTVPVSCTAWAMNGAYTYIFRITEVGTNGQLSLSFDIEDWVDRFQEVVL